MLLGLIIYCTKSFLIPTKPKGDVFFQERFDIAKSPKRWIPTDATNYSGFWSIDELPVPQSFPGEVALIATSSSSHSAVSTKFKQPLIYTNKSLVLQYEVRATIGFTCSGAYIKIFSDPDFQPEKLTNETNYSLMFGPDRCGNNNKIHFIYQSYNKISKKYTLHHLTEAPQAPVDELTHLYTLVIRTNNTYSILLDNKFVKNGSLFFDFKPPIVPPQIITDPKDPQKKIRNPHFHFNEDAYDIGPTFGIGFELWHVNRNITFNNILISHDEHNTLEWNKKNFKVRKQYQEKALIEGLSPNPPKYNPILEIIHTLEGYLSLLSLYEKLFITLTILLPILINIIAFISYR